MVLGNLTVDKIEKEGSLQELAPDCIQADPGRFQGHTEYPRDVRDRDLSDVKTFNRDFAGVIGVWRDPETQAVYVMGGHRRLELARRTKAPTVLVQFLSARTDAEAFAKGVDINIAQWSFDEVDKVTWPCASRRAAVERALHTRSLDPASDAARELYRYYPDLGRRYNTC